MIDAALIQQCADPSLKPAVVEQFIAAAGSNNPLTITVMSGNRVVLVSPPKTSEEAMAIVRQYVGHAVVRVGITQYPAGLGLQDKSDINADLVDVCKNLRLGTALFGRVYRIVMKWYGNAVPEVFEDAVIAYRSGYFEGRSVFREPDPGAVAAATPGITDPEAGDEESGQDMEQTTETVSKPLTEGYDPNNAGIRINLSGIGR